MPFSLFSRKIYFSLTVFSLLVAGVYYYLGGFAPVNTAYIPKQTLVVSGYTFEGKYDSDSLQQLFRKLQLAASPQDTLLVVNFHEFENQKGYVKQLIGITGPGGLQEDTRTATRQFEVAGLVRASIRKHAWVRPRPFTVRRQIEQYAEENKLTLGNYSVEYYISDRELWVEVPVVK